MQDGICEIFSSLQGLLHSGRKRDSEASSAEPSGLCFFLMPSDASGQPGLTDRGAGPGAVCSLLSIYLALFLSEPCKKDLEPIQRRSEKSRCLRVPVSFSVLRAHHPVEGQ